MRRSRQPIANEEVSGVYRGTRWTSQDRDYAIGFIDGGLAVKGPCNPEDLVVGQPYRFFGYFKEDPKWGKQFHFVAFAKELPHTREAVVQYLLRELRDKKVGIGHAKANQLFDLHGPDAVRQLREHPAECAAALGIDVEKAYLAATTLQANAKLENCKIELVGMLAGKGFPKTTIQALVDKWKAQAAAMVRRDAFLMLTHNLPGAGFARCDTLYLANGGDPSKMKRQVLCAWHGLNEESQSTGSTWHPAVKAVRAIEQKIGGADVQPKKAIKIGIRARRIAVHREPDATPWLADGRKAKNEADVAKNLIRLLTTKNRWPMLDSTELSPHQLGCLQFATSAPVGILAGTPGTGKTYTAAALIIALTKQRGVGPGKIAVCAPTGKAAVRLSETLQDYGDVRATTIHRLLQPSNNGHGGGDWGFRFNAENPLPIDFLIVDETSMVETDLMANLLRACHAGTHVLFLGDPYQLPPVGHGAPLRDLIAAGIPCGLLKEIRRNEGLIVEACAAIKDGAPFKSAAKFGPNGDNLKVVPISSPAGIFKELGTLYASIVAQGKRDPIEDVQVFVALNAKTEVGREKLNPFLQQILNPDGEQGEGNRYRVGDKVICLSNDRYPGVDPKGPPEIIYNGEQGRVVESTDTHTTMTFPDVGDGGRTIKLPTKGGDWSSGFDLAYAITVHKSQGSEWPVVVVIGDEGAYRICSREWWYTAISRAKERCLIFASQSLIGRQCRRVTLGDRKTFLRELIGSAFSGPGTGVPPTAVAASDNIRDAQQEAEENHDGFNRSERDGDRRKPVDGVGQHGQEEDGDPSLDEWRAHLESVHGSG